MEKIEARQLKTIDYIVETEGGRYCVLKTADDKGFHKNDRIKKATGRELDENLFYRRTVLMKGQRKETDICKNGKCETCKIFEDFDRRFRTIEMTPVANTSGTVYMMQG